VAHPRFADQILPPRENAQSLLEWEDTRSFLYETVMVGISRFAARLADPDAPIDTGLIVVRMDPAAQQALKMA
jgi:hypothetical protein